MQSLLSFISHTNKDLNKKTHFPKDEMMRDVMVNLPIRILQALEAVKKDTPLQRISNIVLFLIDTIAIHPCL